MLAHSYQVPPLTRGQLIASKANGWFSAGYLAGQEGALREALHPALLDKRQHGMLRYNKSARRRPQPSEVQMTGIANVIMAAFGLVLVSAGVIAGVFWLSQNDLISAAFNGMFWGIPGLLLMAYAIKRSGRADGQKQ